MRVALYVRVSTDAQELEQQLAACRRFCDFKQFEVGDVFAEIGSGKTCARPRFQDMVRGLRARLFDGVVCFRFDRLGRNAREVSMFFDEMEAKGVAVFSIHENLDVTTPIGRAMRDILVRLGQLERENISEATRQRLQALKNMGKAVGRPVGSKDGKPRRKSGYLLRWSKQRGVEKGGVNHA